MRFLEKSDRSGPVTSLARRRAGLQHALMISVGPVTRRGHTAEQLCRYKGVQRGCARPSWRHDAVAAESPQARAGEILRELAEIGYALPGSIVRRSTACGKPGCRCQADPPVLHGPYLSWIRKSDGRAITRKLTPEQERRYRPWFDNARRLQQLIAELQALSVQAIEDAEGWQNRPQP